MKAIHYKELRKRPKKGTTVDIMGNYWILEKERGLIPFTPKMFPASSIKAHAVEMIKHFYGNKFAVLYIPIAYVPSNIVKENYGQRNSNTN